MIKKTKAILVNPGTTPKVQSVLINGYEGIERLLGEASSPEGCTLGKLKENIYLQVWADCEQYMVAPAWVSTFNRQMPIHGLAVIDAYDISTGESIDCPVLPETFLETVEWEPVQERIDPERPNQNWIDRFHLENAHADFVVQYGD
jgi:hypothetical protein